MLEHLLSNDYRTIEMLVHKCYFISISFNILMMLFRNKLLLYNYRAKYLIPGLAIIYSAICVLIAGLIFNLQINSLGEYFTISISRGLVAVGLFQLVRCFGKINKILRGEEVKNV